MAKKLKAKTLIQASRGDVFFVEPEKLTRITDAKHPLFDPRVHKPFNERYVRLMLTRGFKRSQALTVRKNGGQLEIVDGRQRHLAACEANRRIRAEGGETFLKVPVIFDISKFDVDAAETMIIATYMREQDDVIATAEKVLDYMTKFGRTEADASAVFGISEKTVKTYLTLVQLATPVRDAVLRGQLSPTAAVKEFATASREEQVKRLQTVIDSAPAKRAAAKERTPGAEKVESPIARLRRLYRTEEAMAQLTARERAILDWVFGLLLPCAMQEASMKLTGFFDALQKK